MQTQPQATSELQTLFAELAASLHRAAQIVSAISVKTAIPIPILKRPEHIPDDLRWFWSNEWQKMEAEVDEDIKAGHTVGPFESVEELFTSLNS